MAYLTYLIPGMDHFLTHTQTQLYTAESYFDVVVKAKARNEEMQFLFLHGSQSQFADLGLVTSSQPQEEVAGKPLLKNAAEKSAVGNCQESKLT